MKTITANKVKDGWSVEITDKVHLHSESDVFKFVKQNGLQLKKRFFGYAPCVNNCDGIEDACLSCNSEIIKYYAD